MKATAALSAMAILLLMACGRTPYESWPLVWQRPTFELPREVLAAATRRFNQLLGAAYCLTGKQEAAAQVFHTCPAGSSPDPGTLPPSLQSFYAAHAGGSYGRQ